MPTEGVKNWEKWKGEVREEGGELKPSVPIFFQTGHNETIYV